jgi:ADP-ribose pyrophosphatase
LSGPADRHAEADDPDAGEAVRIVERRLEYRGFFDFEVLKLRHRRFDGSLSGVVTREVLHIPQAAAVLPYDPVRDAVVLIEQLRAGSLGHDEGPWLLESVAGLLEPGESPEATARREIVEEAGVEALRLEQIAVYIASPGAVTERSTVFIAQIDSREAGGVHGVAGETEDIRSHVLPRETAFAWLEEGRIVAANAVIPLRWLQVHGAALRRRWLAAEPGDA